MKIRPVSDLHLEFGDMDPPTVEADITLLAGDVFTKRRLAPWPDARSFFKSDYVVMILGNHEFYDGKIDTQVDRLKEIAATKNIILLDNETVDIHGVRIMGSTLWTDFRLHAGDNLAKVKAAANIAVGSRYDAQMNDFRKIRVAAGGYRKFRPLDAATIHNASVKWLGEELERPFDGPKVVMTHHAPSLRCMPTHLQNHKFSPAYASNLEWFIEKHQPDLWIYGHIHEAVENFKIGRTQMCSNPRGYVGHEPNPNFNIDRLIEMPTPEPHPEMF